MKPALEEAAKEANEMIVQIAADTVTIIKFQRKYLSYPNLLSTGTR